MTPYARRILESLQSQDVRPEWALAKTWNKSTVRTLLKQGLIFKVQAGIGWAWAITKKGKEALAASEGRYDG